MLPPYSELPAPPLRCTVTADSEDPAVVGVCVAGVWPERLLGMDPALQLKEGEFLGAGGICGLGSWHPVGIFFFTFLFLSFN